MVEIKSFDFVRINNGAHYEFMKVVSDRFAIETAAKRPMARSRARVAMVKISRAERVGAMPR